MSSPTKTQDVRVDQFFYGSGSTIRSLALFVASCAQLGRTCQSASLDREGRQAAVWASLSELRQWEDFFAYPGTSC